MIGPKAQQAQGWNQQKTDMPDELTYTTSDSPPLFF